MHKLGQFVEAQKRLIGEDYVHSIHDLYGRLAPEYLLADGPIAGSFGLAQRLKKQRKDCATGMISVTILDLLFPEQAIVQLGQHSSRNLCL